MSKLRVIQERVKHDEVEQDLRGLGTSSILTNTHIEPHLIFDSKNSSDEKLNELLQKYSCKLANHSVHQQVKVVTSQRHENFKVSCLMLFNLSLQLIRHKIAHSVDLGETNWLHVELQNALVHKENGLMPNYKKSDSNEKGISLTPVFSHALSQAGYQISPSMENTFLNENHIAEILNHLKHTDSLKVRNLRVA